MHGVFYPSARDLNSGLGFIEQGLLTPSSTPSPCWVLFLRDRIGMHMYICIHGKKDVRCRYRRKHGDPIPLRKT